MRLLTQTLCLLLALALSCAAPTHHDIMMADHHGDHHDHEAHHSAKPDRCDGIEFDAIAPDEKGITYFFKGDHLWRGYNGSAELSNETFRELDEDHNLGHVDAAFRMHNGDDLSDHDHIYFFLNDKVFSYYNHSMEPGYPKQIQDVFPGIPDHLDAAVECPKGECTEDTVIFFKEDEVYSYDITTKAVKQRKWTGMPNCTSAYRWVERYYCFHGHNFSRFHPQTGHVEPQYPKDARSYFMKCENFGHGGDYANCTGAHLDAVTSDDKGKSYAFRGDLFLRLDSHRDGWHAFSISSAWKEVHNDLNAVFFHDGKLYIIKGDEIYIYKTDAHYTLVEGYPKPLKEELGIEGPVDAAFVCAEQQHTVHVIQGHNMKYIDLSATPRTVIKDIPIPYSKIDAASCGPDGVKVYVGEKYFQYESPMIMAMGKIKAVPHMVPHKMLGCSH